MLSFFFSILESDADRQVFAALYVQYHTKLESIAIRILKNQSDAEDAVQNTFIQVIRHFEKINQIPCEDLLFWLISIVKNEAYMILRKIPNTVSLRSDLSRIISPLLYLVKRIHCDYSNCESDRYPHSHNYRSGLYQML